MSKRWKLVIVLVVAIAIGTAMAQISTVITDLGGYIGGYSGFAYITPAAVGMNGAVLPASGFVLTNWVNTVGMKAATFHVTCDQGFGIAIQTSDDGTTSLVGGGWVLKTGFTASTTGTLFLGTEIDASTSIGAVTPNNIRFPQRWIRLQVTNGGAVAGTCTTRIYATY